MDASALQLIILPAGLIAVLFAIYLARDVLSRDTGTPEMEAVAGTIFEGAVAFIRRQYTTIGILALVGSVLIGILITLIETKDVADVQSLAGAPIGIMTGIAFIVGAACSMASGIIGMFISVKANVRTASAARRSLVEAVQVAMRGGAVSGFLVVALSLLGVWGIFTVYSTFIGDVTVAEAPFLIVGFGFGASFVALFAQLGGGIYTKAADAVRTLALTLMNMPMIPDAIEQAAPTMNAIPVRTPIGSPASLGTSATSAVSITPMTMLMSTAPTIARTAIVVYWRRMKATAPS